VREDWDELIAEMVADPNKGHFRKNEDWDHVDWDGMDPELKQGIHRFPDLVLHRRILGLRALQRDEAARGNKDITQLFQLMARDEARHAGFINDALREAGVAVNLGFLTQKKKYTYFRPKFIYYATYLSEKIGYARYITIFRHLEAHPEHRFHPIFKWFEEWCNDEFSHGEAFALLMKTDPKLTQGNECLLDQVLPDGRLCHDVCARPPAPGVPQGAGRRYRLVWARGLHQDLEADEADLPDHAGYRPSALAAEGAEAAAPRQCADRSDMDRAVSAAS
jgi:hypothetical protein